MQGLYRRTGNQCVWRFRNICASILLCWTAHASASSFVWTGPRIATPPSRVVVLTWESTEQLLELGITPIAVADRDDYRTWVGRPAIPSGVINVGSRSEPNLGLLAELKPDLIVMGPQHQGLQPALSRIAPTLSIEAYSASHHNPTVAREIFLQLARVFQREAYARQRLQQLDEQFSAWRAAINGHFQGHPPAVCLIRFNSPTVFNIYGDNSMPDAVMKRLGLVSACPVPSSATPWGTQQRRTLELAELKQGELFYFEPFTQHKRLFDSTLWQQFPLVRQQHVHALPSTWTFGGEFSLGYIAEELTQALLQLPAETHSYREG